MSHSASELGGPELAELGGHSFDVGGPSFEVGGPSSRSYEDTEAADLEAEDEGLDGLFVTPPPSPNGKDDGVEAGKDDGKQLIHLFLVWLLLLQYTTRAAHLRDEAPSQSTPSTRSTRKTQVGPQLCDGPPSQSTPSTRRTRESQRGPEIRDEPPLQSTPSTHSTTHSIQIPHLRDEETPSQSTGEPLSVPLTRSRRLSQLLSGIVEVNDNAVAAVRVSRKKACRAETPYKEAPAAESLQMHPARKNPPSTRSIVAATGIASRIRMRTSSRLQKFGSQGGSQSTPVVIDLTASKAGAGVRCSWGPPGRGGVQFRVSQPPLGSGAADNDKAPLTKSKGVKDKGKKPRWQI
ncbi:hypothetical protein CJ030_MR7G013496 [Morella rubra]|uniref:Uncharacterized protein n=1 Tax=Morella rubra TaxID=262757 RepID=A0A6A1V4I3_9ROSI|nr:hypothetical protein CJ030_MR7G013496 [Morella rubra]